jgi:hypothetical protein
VLSRFVISVIGAPFENGIRSSAGAGAT